MGEIASPLPSTKTPYLGKSCYTQIYPSRLIKEIQLNNAFSVGRPSLLVKSGRERGFSNRYIQSYLDKSTRKDWQKGD